MITHNVIRGLILYQIDILCSINNITNKINQSTNIQEPIVHTISNILLFHLYIKVHITRMARITAIIIGINFELL